MLKTVSLGKASFISVFFHLTLVLVTGLAISGFVEEHVKAEYVIDLDMYEQAQGQADEKSPEELFPEKLSQEETSQRIEQAAALTTAPSPAPLSENDITLKRGNPSSIARQASGSTAPAAPAAAAGGGSGKGSGSSSESSGNSGGGGGAAEKPAVPVTPFDFAGFANAVEANKEYPYQAIKRGLEGAVTMRIVLNGGGGLVSCDVAASSGSNILDNAAIKAVRNACPYPNATGENISFTTTIHFNLT